MLCYRLERREDGLANRRTIENMGEGGGIEMGIDYTCDSEE